MRKYEVMVLVDPSVDEHQVESLMDRYLKVVKDEKGTVDNVDVWGKRRLAYEIQKKTEGIYIVLTFTAKSSTAQELDRQLGLNESVMRTKVMRLDAA